MTFSALSLATLIYFNKGGIFLIDFLSESQISEILKTAQKAVPNLPEIFIEDKKVCTIGADGGKIEQLNMGEEQGLGHCASLTAKISPMPRPTI